MKKVISMVLALSMAVMLIVGLTGCSENKTTSSKTTSSETTSSKTTSSETTSSNDMTNTTSSKDNSTEEKVELVSDTVNGMTLMVPNDLSEFTEKKGVMRAMNEVGTASIAIGAAKDAGGGSPEAYTEENFQASQMTTYTDVKFIEFNNKATLDGVPAVYAHATGTNPNGVNLELYNYIVFFENGNYQSIVMIFSEGSNTFLQANIQTVIDSIKLSK